MKLKYLLATSALVLPGIAQAQSTGSVDFEENVIVVTGTTISSPATIPARRCSTASTSSRA